VYDQSLFLQTLSRFARVLPAHYDVETALAELTESVTGVLGLCGSGVTMLEDGRLRFVTAVSEASGELERIQEEQQSGPCQDAYDTGEVVRVTDVRVETVKWPESAAAAKRLGVAGGAGIPMRLAGQIIGALNLYSAEPREWSEDVPLDWGLVDGASGSRHRQVQQLVTELNRLYRSEPALHELDTAWEGFAWIDGSDAEHSIVAILRRSSVPDDAIVVVCNWQPIPQADYAIGVPLPGRWEELLNTDASAYGGFGVSNDPELMAQAAPLDGHPYSLSLTIPPLSVLWLKPAAVESPHYPPLLPTATGS